jgi:hypothetical protein
LIVKYSFFQKISYFALSLSKRVDDMKNSIFSLCSLFICLFPLLKAEAQNSSQVLAAKSISSNGKPIVLGQKLNPDQSIELGDSAFLILQNKNQIWEVKAKGKYKIGKLVKQIPDSTNLENSYIKFVLEQLDDKDKSKHNLHLRKTGDVTCKKTYSFDVTLPNGRENEIYGNSAVVRVFLNKKKFPIDQLKEFRIYLTDMSDEVLLEQTLHNGMGFIDLNKVKIVDIMHGGRNIGTRHYIILKVIALKKDSTQTAYLSQLDGQLIERMDNEKSQEIKKELDKIQIPQADALTKLVEARFFEEKGLLMDAVVAYFKAIELSNHCPQFKEMYEAFLIRNGLNKPETVAPDENIDK